MPELIHGEKIMIPKSHFAKDHQRFDEYDSLAASYDEVEESPFPISRVGDTYDDYAETEWLIEDVIEANSLAQLFADPESYKSFLAIAFGCCIATGTPWLNHPVKQGGVVFVVGEGLRGLNKRFKAWSHHNGVSLDDAPLYYTHRPADFMTATSAKELVTGIKQMVGDQSIELIVIDTLARNMSGNESSPEDMAVFIGIIDRMLRAEFDCTVMPIHHPGVHDKTRARGTNALKGAVDTDMRMHHPDRDKHPDTVIFECMKQKNEDRFAPIVLDFKVLDWGRLDSRGNEIRSGVLVPSRIDPKEFNIKSEALGKRARKALESLKKALKKHGGGAVPGQYWRDECASEGLNLDDNGKPMARSFRNVYSDAKAELFRKRYISTNDQGDIYPL